MANFGCVFSLAIRVGYLTACAAHAGAAVAALLPQRPPVRLQRRGLEGLGQAVQAGLGEEGVVAHGNEERHPVGCRSRAVDWRMRGILFAARMLLIE